MSIILTGHHTWNASLHYIVKYTVSQNCPTPNSVCSSWISTKYRTLHYLDISYGHTHYDIRTLPCVLSITPLWRQSLFALRYVQCIVVDKGIKQQCTSLRLRACVEAKGGHFKQNFKDKFRMIISMTVSNFVKNLANINDFTITYL